MWYAEDSTVAGKLTKLREWWDQLTSEGSNFSYFANAPKTWLVIKQGLQEEARTLFGNTNVNITSYGRPHLSAAIGSEEFIREYVKSKDKELSSAISLLSEIALSQPHAAYAALTHGLLSR